eukprot:jgi/Undpi1/3405/HiC_scaffold_15.g06778.m1
MNTYDGDQEQEKEQPEGPKGGRKRNRRKGGKKATHKEPPAAAAAATQRTDDTSDKGSTLAAAEGNISVALGLDSGTNNTKGGGIKKQRSSNNRGRGMPKHQKLDVNEWPTPLGSQGGEKPLPQPARPSTQPEQQEEEEEDLAALHAQLLKASQSSNNAAAAAGAIHNRTGTADGRVKTGTIGVGDKVEARFEGGMEWFPAIVTKTLHGGLVNLLYDDGERETRVSLSLVCHRGARGNASPGSDSVSDSDSDAGDEAEPARAYNPVPVGGGGKARGNGWMVMAQKPKKTSQERVESRAEASSNLKNRIKRQKKREKEVAAREALRKKL